MIRIAINPRTTRSLTQRLSLVSEGLRDVRPLAPQFRAIFSAFMKRHFQTRGAYANASWAPLSPRYAAWKRKHYPGKPLMRLRDTLYSSLTQESHQNAITKVSRSRIEIGTSVPYARAHQYGVARRNLPARVVIPQPTRNEGEQLADAVLAYLLKLYRTGTR